MVYFTQLDIDNHQRRVTKGKPVAVASDAVSAGHENKLHADIIAYCEQKVWPYFRSGMHEKTGRRPGEPDFEIWASEGRTFHIECKTKTGKLSPEQVALKFWAEKLGHQYHVVRSMREFIEIVEPKL